MKLQQNLIPSTNKYIIKIKEKNMIYTTAIVMMKIIGFYTTVFE